MHLFSFSFVFFYLLIAACFLCSLFKKSDKTKKIRHYWNWNFRRKKVTFHFQCSILIWSFGLYAMLVFLTVNLSIQNMLVFLTVSKPFNSKCIKYCLVLWVLKVFSPIGCLNWEIRQWFSIRCLYTYCPHILGCFFWLLLVRKLILFGIS